MESLQLTEPSSQAVLTGLAGTSGHAILRVGAGVNTCDIEILVQDGASWDVTIIVEGVHGSSPFTMTQLKIAQHHTIGIGASLKLHIVTLHPNVDHDVRSHVTGENSESGIDWMFYGKGSEKQVLNVRNVFDGREGQGEVFMRGIAEDHAYSTCKGLIEIGLQGGGTNTYLTQEVLMLDATSKVDAIPALEIKTNDVKASHSATIARVTEEDLFYFGARGISPHEARRMFVLGFLGDMTEKVPDEKVRAEVIEAIEKKYLITKH